MELHYLSIAELSRGIQERTVSPVEVVDSVLRRIDLLNPRLNAFITVTAEQAIASAKEAESDIMGGKWKGPLHGIPVGIKDFYDTAGVRTTAAFEYFRNRVPRNDAVSVTRLREAGAIVIGKTNMHRLGMGTSGMQSFFGPPRNPWNEHHIPGGSSSGSAVAVAAGMCYATLDTDAVGSCRLPAACCGVVGFKGSYGRIDMRGILEGEAPPDKTILWLGHAGITTRSVADAAILLNVLSPSSEPIGVDNLGTPRVMRVGIGSNFRADADVAKSFRRATQVILGLGHRCHDLAAPLVDLNGGIENIEADRASVMTMFDDSDVMVLPTTPSAVPGVEEGANNPQALSPENTLFANYYGLPAISVPNGFDSRGLPLGLQIVGKAGNEAAVLSLASQFEEHSGHRRRHPL